MSIENSESEEIMDETYESEEQDEEEQEDFVE